MALFEVVFWIILSFPFISGRFTSCIVKDFPVLQNFDVSRYVGRWYEQETILFPGQPDETKLRKIVTTVEAVTPSIQSTYGIGREPATGKCIEELLICRQTDPPTGRFNITFITTSEPQTSQFILVDTNYFGYVVFYGCFAENMDRTCKTPFVITETRTPKKTPSDTRAINRILDRLCIDRRLLVQLRVGKPCPEPVIRQCRRKKTYG